MARRVIKLRMSCAHILPRSVQPRVCRGAVCLDIGRGRASTLEREPTPPARHGSGNGHRGHDACVALTSPLSEKKRAPSLGERARAAAIQACKQPGGESLSPTPVLFVPGGMCVKRDLFIGLFCGLRPSPRDLIKWILCSVVNSRKMEEGDFQQRTQVLDQVTVRQSQNSISEQLFIVT